MLDTVDHMVAFAGTAGGMASFALAVAVMILIRKVGHGGRRRTD